MDDDQLTDLAADLHGALVRVPLALGRNAIPEGITVPKALALATIADFGPMRMGELAEREAIRTPTATALVDGLATQGLVTRESDPTDRRVVVIKATPAGRARLAEIRHSRNTVLAGALRGLDDAQLAALRSAAPALSALRSALEQR